ncbi:cytochrome c maturation protein CcmE [candidate division KSB1 bacterium]|nr:cytochrome c maturation protein CcmE [candidate division KSB1 bacterium]
MKPKILIGVIIIVIALGYIIIGGIKETAVYYLTVSEFRANKDLKPGDGVRLSGYVVPSSIRWDPEKIELNFAMYEEADTINVFYKGVMPDQLADAQMVVTEGQLTESGTLLANKILLKCPSKYETASPEEHLQKTEEL